MPNKKNLELKLRAIQQLKSEKYIGTSEAGSYLERVSALYENSDLIPKLINRGLSREGVIYYPAAPEKILGLGDFLSESSNNFIFYNKVDVVVSEQEKLDKCPLFDFRHLILGKPNERNPELLAEYLYSIFKNLQEPDIKNIQFGVYSIKYVLNMSGSNKETIEFFLDKAETDWDYICSLENLRRIEKESERDIYFKEINIINRINRMKKDLVDNRLENRREILTDYIGSIINNTPKSDHNYYYLKKIALEQLEKRKELYDKLKDIHYSPEAVINRQKGLIEKSEFIIRALNYDENFVRRYLRS